MQACPRCRAPGLDRGFCAQCGFHDPRLAEPAPPPPPAPPPVTTPRVVTGTPAHGVTPVRGVPAVPPPVVVGEPSSGGVTLPGFESTSLVSSAPPPPPPPAASASAPASTVDFAYATCPRCRQPQPNPPETFCPHCSYRVVVRRKKAGLRSTDRVKTCKDCGTENDPERTSCVNCGFRLSE